MSTIIFGGTFDPIHNAHIEMARAAAKQVERPRVLFVPAGTPPHRATVATYDDRLAMVRIACLNEPLFKASNIEESTDKSTDKSYSILTIEKVRLRVGSDPLYFLIGADAFAEIETWHRWREVVEAVEFIVVARPRANYHIPSAAQVCRVSLDLDVSSSQIRKDLASGKSDVAVPGGVLDYIRQNRLYELLP